MGRVGGKFNVKPFGKMRQPFGYYSSDLNGHRGPRGHRSLVALRQKRRDLADGKWMPGGRHHPPKSVGHSVNEAVGNKLMRWPSEG